MERDGRCGRSGRWGEAGDGEVVCEVRERWEKEFQPVFSLAVAIMT